ncbi:TonB-dependent hemoglobin/transferrin/lactoferrin family receptor [Pseudomonas sp.]|uniref:TonB-dependent hemoglobin/transferrin/lactoferrin family receptor n=1 Tax=Pseudomonas sp. TaxID=306 RepID=UPI002580DC5D|nr:TonB-dependent hemoglobin/transferrin/lactoferrin family receptor [Pseudomonas sp.]
MQRPPFALRPWLPLLLLGASATHAAEPAVTQFDTVSVTATRSERTLDKVPSTVSVQDERQIDQQNINNISDLVRYEPGVTVSGTGSRFGLSGFNIRGIGDNRILTQVDGVPTADAFTFGPFLNARRDYVDLDTVKQVEIIRGPASSLYGSDAIGGAVSFLTKDAGDYLEDGDDTYLRFKTGYDGSDDSWQRSATFAGRQGQFDGLLHLGRRDGQATDTYGGASGIGSGRGEANPQDFNNENFLGKLGWSYNETDRLQFTYERFNAEADTKILSDYATTGTTRTSDAVDSTDRERFSLQHQFDLSSAITDGVEWQLSYQDSLIRQQTFQDRFSAGTFRERTRDSKYREELWTLNSKFDKAFATGDAQHQVIYGFDIKHLESSDLRRGSEVYTATGLPTPPSFGGENFPLSDFPDPTANEYALFAQDSIEIGRWTLLPGLRYDYYEMKPDVTQEYLNSVPVNTNPDNYDDHALSPKLAVSYQIDDAYSVYGQYAAGFRAPNPVDVFGEFVNSAFGYQTIASPDLEAETSNSYELGLRGKFDQGSFGLALFYNEYDDFIEQVSLSSDPTGNGIPLTFQYQNLNKVTIRGAEAKGDLFLGSYGMPEGTRLRGAIAYARGRDEDTGQPINSVDPLKSVIGLGYDAPNGEFGGELAWTLVAAKERVDKSAIPNQFEPAGYGTLDLNGYWQVSEQFSVNAGLYNLTDKQYWQWGDVRSLTADSPSLDRYSQPGRYAAVNMIWEM